MTIFNGDYIKRGMSEDQPPTTSNTPAPRSGTEDSKTIEPLTIGELTVDPIKQSITWRDKKYVVNTEAGKAIGLTKKQGGELIWALYGMMLVYPQPFQGLPEELQKQYPKCNGSWHTVSGNIPIVNEVLSNISEELSDIIVNRSPLNEKNKTTTASLALPLDTLASKDIEKLKLLPVIGNLTYSATQGIFYTNQRGSPCPLNKNKRKTPATLTFIQTTLGPAVLFQYDVSQSLPRKRYKKTDLQRRLSILNQFIRENAPLPPDAPDIVVFRGTSFGIDPDRLCEAENAMIAAGMLVGPPETYVSADLIRAAPKKAVKMPTAQPKHAKLPDKFTEFGNWGYGSIKNPETQVSEDAIYLKKHDGKWVNINKELSKKRLEPLTKTETAVLGYLLETALENMQNDTARGLSVPKTDMDGFLNKLELGTIQSYKEFCTNLRGKVKAVIGKDALAKISPAFTNDRISIKPYHDSLIVALDELTANQPKSDTPSAAQKPNKAQAAPLPEQVPETPAQPCRFIEKVCEEIITANRDLSEEYRVAATRLLLHESVRTIFIAALENGGTVDIRDQSKTVIEAIRKRRDVFTIEGNTLHISANAPPAFG